MSTGEINSVAGTRVDLDFLDPGIQRDRPIQIGGVDQFHDQLPANQLLALLEKGQAVPNRTIRRLRLDTNRSVTILLDYTDTIGPQRPNAEQFEQTLRRFERVVGSLQAMTPVQSIYLWGTFPLDLQVQAGALARTHFKLQRSFLSPEKVAWMVTSEGVTHKRRLSREFLEIEFSQRGLTDTNIILIDNGGVRWPFHLAGLAQVVVPTEKEDGIIDCVGELGRHLERIYASGAQQFDQNAISSEVVDALEGVLRQRIEAVSISGRTKAVLERMKPRIHTRDIRDFLHPDRIRFIAEDDELLGFVDEVLGSDGENQPVANGSTFQPPDRALHPSARQLAGLRGARPTLLRSLALK